MISCKAWKRCPNGIEINGCRASIEMKIKAAKDSLENAMTQIAKKYTVKGNNQYDIPLMLSRLQNPGIQFF